MSIANATAASSTPFACLTARKEIFLGEDILLPFEAAFAESEATLEHELKTNAISKSIQINARFFMINSFPSSPYEV